MFVLPWDGIWYCIRKIISNKWYLGCVSQGSTIINDFLIICLFYYEIIVKKEQTRSWNTKNVGTLKKPHSNFELLFLMLCICMHDMHLVSLATIKNRFLSNARQKIWEDQYIVNSLRAKVFVLSLKPIGPPNSEFSGSLLL